MEAEQSSYYREYPVAFGQKREKVGVGQSDTANKTLCRYCFQVHPFLVKKHRELPFLAITHEKSVLLPYEKESDYAHRVVINCQLDFTLWCNSNLITEV